MSLQMLIAELLEIVKDLLLDDGRQALDLLHKDTLTHLYGAHVTDSLLYCALAAILYLSLAIHRIFYLLLQCRPRTLTQLKLFRFQI